MHKVVDVSNTEKWFNTINSFREADVYFHPGYLKTFSENGDGKPMLFYIENEYGRAANIFLVRDVYKDERLRRGIKPDTYFDISTVYGYGGPIYDTVDLERFSKSYLDEFKEFCIEMNIVSEFIRFHPVLKNQVFLENIYDIANIRTTVYMDLSQGEQHIWDDLDCKNRNNIRKAQKTNMKIIFGRDKFLIDEFKRLYNQTMDKDSASGYYYFNENFFYKTISELPDNSLIFAAELENKIIAASVIIFTEKFVHCHFLASDITYQNIRPVNLLVYEVARWGCKERKMLLHLGGGVRGDDDNLFRFKKTFSKSNRLPFYIGKKVYNEDIYNKLVEIRANCDDSFDINTDYFPKYRG